MNLATDEPVWNFWSSLLFCGTVTTTIGYGFIVPKTISGRATCIVFALLGIPLCLMVLTRIGQLMTSVIKKCGYKLYLCVRFSPVWKCCQLYKKTTSMAAQKPDSKSKSGYHTASTTTSGNPPTDEATTISEPDRTESEDTVYEEEDFEPSPLFSMVFVVLYALLGAFMYQQSEHWTYFESVYFIVISLTTIGFGDISPHHPQFFISRSIYLIVGLALVSMLINTVVIFVKKSYKKALELGQRAKEQLDDFITDADGEEQEESRKNKLKQHMVTPRLSLQSDRLIRCSPESGQETSRAPHTPPDGSVPLDPGIIWESDSHTNTDTPVYV